MKVDLTLGESKTKVSLTLEDKGADQTWAETDPETWEDQDGDWDTKKISATLESKTKDDLNLETK
jgi:hypothetical protein